MNAGCEYYHVSVRYEFAEAAHDKNDKRWWFGKAAGSLLRADELGANPVFDLKADAQMINSVLSQKKLPEDILEVPVEGDGTDFLQTRVSITNYGELPRKTGSFVELELVKGPL